MGYLVKVLPNGHYAINEVWWHDQVVLRDGGISEDSASLLPSNRDDESTTSEAELEQNCGNRRSIQSAASILIHDLNNGNLAKVPVNEIGYETIRGLGIKNGHTSYSWVRMLLPGASCAASSSGQTILILRCCKSHVEKISYIPQQRQWVRMSTSIDS